MGSPLNVLFLCTHNSARSVLAECLLNHLGAGRFRAFSAGSQPSGRVNPFALQALAEAGVDTTGVCSKNWDTFAVPGAPEMDLIITVCDSAAGEICPVWPGHPATAHWGYADPSATTGPDAARLMAFRDTMTLIRRRLEILVALPAERLDALRLEQTARSLADR
ncbi:arsenate reductase ArsC [Methyloversatilis sp.]|uniref:arsenate reductase ArsC n=1 Tax=Methyloversatilis sp. TaxID=2569862 RepID=UPI0027368879|nr:arsenate reductase ArsC [Methyloversatilis sp.]MDP2867985.1 arsenate reductase ArsC [Methyloversatilis sp.]MDP3290090.1 arsenate reductase ArsC [Methyloversatilis sp.]MDP3455623.1 arsenate reductase ArsC [Methyloversatilis sp.]MDP3577484.1 arsenate reductase ArsC [Methyloversatilis sp.]